MEFLTINSEKEFCLCCGKQGLQKVAWLVDSENDGEAKHYGIVCAGKLLKKGQKSKMKSFNIDNNKNIIDETKKILEHPFASEIFEVLTDNEIKIEPIYIDGVLNHQYITTPFDKISLSGFLRIYTDCFNEEIIFPHRLDINFFITNFKNEQ